MCARVGAYLLEPGQVTVATPLKKMVPPQQPLATNRSSGRRDGARDRTDVGTGWDRSFSSFPRKWYLFFQQCLLKRLSYLPWFWCIYWNSYCCSCLVCFHVFYPTSLVYARLSIVLCTWPLQSSFRAPISLGSFHQVVFPVAWISYIEDI